MASNEILKKAELCQNQSRWPRIFENVGWFYKDGTWIGSGDLEADDIRRIYDELDENDLFFIIEEKITQALMETEPDSIKIMLPLLSHCVIEKKGVYINYTIDIPSESRMRLRMKVDYKEVNPQFIKNLQEKKLQTKTIPTGQP